MRTLEVITAIFLFITWGGYLIPPDKRPRPFIVLPFITVVTAFIQIIVEQYRWQMVPIYALATVLFAISLPRLVGPPRTKNVPMKPILRLGRRARIIKIAGLVLKEAVLLMAIALPALIPVFRLPEPTGPYTVGTMDYEWVDESRLETFTPAPNDQRDLLVRVWYPVDKNVAERTPPEKPTQSKPEGYGPEVKAGGPLLAKFLGMPSFIFDHLELVQSHSYRKAPLSQAQKTYPVLLFSHGYGMAVNQNTAQMEELASHGYIIFSIAHPYESLAVMYPSGRVVPASPSIWDTGSKEANLKVQSVWRQYLKADNPEAQVEFYRQYLALRENMQTSLSNWTDDTIFVLNEIERINHSESGDPLVGRLDLDRVGVFGQSFGGAMAGETCRRDSRFKAAANLDGFQYGDLLDYPIKQPLMMMYSQTTENCNEMIYSRGANNYYRVNINTATQFNYSDFSLFSPLFKYTGYVGPINGSRMEVILNHYLLAFFDKYLKGIDSPLLYGPDPSYPEVDFQVRHLK